jgi:hypothetical protein
MIEKLEGLEAAKMKKMVATEAEEEGRGEKKRRGRGNARFMTDVRAGGRKGERQYL